MTVRHDSAAEGGLPPPLRPRPGAEDPWAAFLRVQGALILREIATRYGRTPGGSSGRWRNRWPPFWC
jgi:hypothetical protein